MFGNIMTGILSTKLNFIEKKLLEHPRILGVLLFKRNIENRNQLTYLIESMQEIRIKKNLPSLIIAIDHEGGDVQRLRLECITALPSPHKIGNIYQNDIWLGQAIIKAVATVTAYELNQLNINLCFAPVLDLGHSRKINHRAYSHQANLITEISYYYLSAMKQYGMNCVAKHFPGNANTKSNPHHFFSYSKKALSLIWDEDLLPYRSLIKDELLQNIMVSHLIYEKAHILPASFSPFWLKTMLREKLNFKGLIISDCLQMSAIDSYRLSLKDKMLNSLNAGCDVVLSGQTSAGNYRALYEALQSAECMNQDEEGIKRYENNLNAIYQKQVNLTKIEYEKAKQLLNSYSHHPKKISVNNKMLKLIRNNRTLTKLIREMLMRLNQFYYVRFLICHKIKNDLIKFIAKVSAIS